MTLLPRRSPARYLLMAFPVVLALVLVGPPLYRQTLATPLLKAVSQQDPDAVAGLLRRGAPPNATDENGRTALFLSLSGSPSSGGADPFLSPSFPRVPEGRERITVLLLRAGAAPNVSWMGEPDLYLALEAPSLVSVKALLAYGADPNALYSQMPLLMKAVQDDAELYATGKEEVPLYTQAMLAAGADARVHRPFQKVMGSIDTMIPWGIFREELPLVVAVHYAGRTDFLAAMAYKRRGNAGLISTLLDHGAIIDARDHEGHTALSIAAAQADPEDVRVLLAHGADPSISDRHGHTALQSMQEAEAKELTRARANNEKAQSTPHPVPQPRSDTDSQRRIQAANQRFNDEADIKARYDAVQRLLVETKPADRQ